MVGKRGGEDEVVTIVYTTTINSLYNIIVLLALFIFLLLLIIIIIFSLLHSRRGLRNPFADRPRHSRGFFSTLHRKGYCSASSFV